MLEADTLYETRLVPLLLHEDFSEDLVGWRAVGGDLSDWQLRGHKTLRGQTATVAGVVVGLNGSPELSALDPTFDFIVLQNDTLRPFGRYRIISVDNAAKTVTVDSAPRLSSASSEWEIPSLGTVVAASIAETTLVREEPEWSDYHLSAYLRLADDKPVGLFFRHRDDGNFYRFSMDRQNRSRRLEKVVGGTSSTVAEDGFAFEPNRDYLITVEAIGTSLRIYQDGALVFEETDDSVSTGGIGLYSGGNAGARFSDVRVDDLRAEAPVAYRFDFITSRFANFFHHFHGFQDETWRETLTPLGATDAEIAALVAAVLPTNDVPSEVEARAYEAFAKKVLGAAAALKDPPEVEVTRVERDGMALAFLVRSPEPIDWGRTDLEILRAERSSPSLSPPGIVKLTDVTFGVSRPNEESVTLLLREAAELTGQRIEYRAFEQVLLDEAFDVETPDRWAFVEEGDQDRPQQWEVSGGELRQTGDIHGGDLDASAHEKPGTHALAGEATWADYRLSVTLTSDADGAIGAMFRYQDANNYYRFSMDRARSYRRMIRKVGGVVSVLWEDNVQYILGREYVLTLECVGKRLTGYLDDNRLFDLKDDALSTGLVGLYCWSNPGARFAQAQVHGATWVPYYAFGEEGRLPAGTRVRLFAGNAADAPAEPPPEERGVIRRFVAPGNESGGLRLPHEGVDLRLAPSGGIENHARRFLPDDTYAPVRDARVLREADGTGFFVVVPAFSPVGSQFLAGQYRLKLLYRRDNSDKDPKSIVFSEAGNSEPERVTVDVPWDAH